MRENNFAGTIEEYEIGNAVKRKLVENFLSGMEILPGLLACGPKIGGFLGIIVVFIEAEQHKSFGFILFIQFFERGERFAAGHTPCGPEIEEHWFARKRLKCYFLTSGSFEGKRGNGLADKFGQILSLLVLEFLYQDRGWRKGKAESVFGEMRDVDFGNLVQPLV